MTTEAETRAEDGVAPSASAGSRLPTAFTVLFFLLALVWILTFTITPGTYSHVSGHKPRELR